MYLYFLIYNLNEHKNEAFYFCSYSVDFSCLCFLPETENDFNAPTEESFFRNLYRIWVKRWRLIVSIALVVIAFGTYVTLTATPLYTATATLKIEPQSFSDRVGGASLVPGGDDGNEYYETQYALLKSRPLAAQVIVDLRLESNSLFRNYQNVWLVTIKI